MGWPWHLRFAAVAGLMAFAATISLGFALHAASGGGGQEEPNAAGEITVHVPGVGDVITVDPTHGGPVVLDRVHGQVTIPQVPGISWGVFWGEGDADCDYGLLIFLPARTGGFFCERTAEFEFINIQADDADTIRRIIDGQTGYTLRPAQSTGDLP